MTDDGMRLYEGMILVDAGFANKDEKGALDLCTGIIEKYDATIIRAEKWAEQKLAYEIRKAKRGAYYLIAFRAHPLKIAEIEMECRLTEKILRYMFLNREGVPIDRWFRRYAAAPSRERPADTRPAAAAAS